MFWYIETLKVETAKSCQWRLSDISPGVQNVMRDNWIQNMWVSYFPGSANLSYLQSMLWSITWKLTCWMVMLTYGTNMLLYTSGRTKQLISLFLRPSQGDRTGFLASHGSLAITGPALVNWSWLPSYAPRIIIPSHGSLIIMDSPAIISHFIPRKLIHDYRATM